jgi:hypothetical protein
LFNRHSEKSAGGAYTVFDKIDMNWLREIEGIDNPLFISVNAFLKK